MGAIPLAPEDRAILALESDTVAGHTCKVLRVGGAALDVEALRSEIEARIEHAPLLTRQLGSDGDTPLWVDADDFDIAAHVLAAGDVALDDAALRSEVARLFCERLDRSRPLWRIDVFPLANGGSALIWRIHHALADGTAAMRLADQVLWSPTAGATEPEAPATAPPTGAPPNARSNPAPGTAPQTGAAASAPPTGAPPNAPRGATTRHPLHLAGFLRRELPLGAAASPFDGTICAAREVAFARVPLHALHDAAKQLDGASLNDAVLTLVAGALRRWIEHQHGSLSSVRVRVPVSLHEPGDDAGNRDSFFSLPLPLRKADPIARLDAIHAATSGRKRGHDAQTLDSVMSDLAHVSPHLRALAERVEASPRGFALNVSNVPGPRDPVSVLGAPVESIHSIAEIGERHALRVAAVSLAGELGFGFCSDPDIVGDLQLLADGVEAEAATLIAAASS